MRMIVSSTRKQSIDVIAFFVNLSFEGNFYSNQIHYFSYLKTNI
ncbi:hypothetical protein AGR7B_Lc50279 [Agrobacterium deltaense RV3]|nr:hypothetical protein AGR7B_Lc50279 [Agrobacterium deltaense RV3]